MNILTRRAVAWRHYPLIRALIGSLILAAGAAEAVEPLTLDEAGRLALQRQPVLEGFTAQIRALRESAVAARQLPDPQAYAGVSDLPVNTDDAYSLQRDSDTQLQLGLMQEFPRAEKRRLRGERVERNAQRLQAERDLAERSIRRDAALGWLELWRYDQLLNLNRASLREAETQQQAVEIALKTGTATQAEFLAARQEADRLRDAMAGTEQGIAHARNALSRWIGEAAQSPVSSELPVAPPLPALTAVLDRVRRHPQLAGTSAQVSAAQTDAELAQAAYKPDWRVELGYGYRPAFSEMVMLQVGIDLPVFTGQRQDRDLAAALAQKDAAEFAAEDSLRQLLSDARLNHHDHERLTLRLKDYDQTLLPQSQNRITAALAGWRAGRNALREVLDARRAALEIRMTRLDLQLDLARHTVQLTYLGAYDTASADPGYDHE